ncbi:MAG: hypothetical protein GXP25_16850 [Planctomycetes bacterium]|nr:hypothetical protein [Planctomycetota bacterium]
MPSRRQIIAMWVFVLATSALLLSDDRTVKSQTSALHLLPAPQEIERSTPKEGFRLNRDVVISRCFSATVADELTVKDLARGIEQTTGIALAVELGLRDARAILLGIPKRDEGIAEECAKLGLTLDDRIGEEGYVLRVTPERVLLLANTSTGLFYGAQTLRQLADPESKSIPCVTIRDWPDFPQRWMMYDIGRFQTVNTAYCKRIIENLARVKLNGFAFTMEDDSDSTKYPHHKEALNGDTFAELSAFAERYHIQLVSHFHPMEHIVCPSVAGALALYPNVQAGFDNTRHLLRYAAEHKLLGACICAPSLYRGANFETSWPGILFAAECAWSSAKANPDDFARTFARRWFGIQRNATADMKKLLYFPYCGPKGKQFWRTPSTSAEIFFMPPTRLRRYLRVSVQGNALSQSLELLALTDETLASVDRMKDQAKRNLTTLDFIEFAVLNYRHVARKCLLIEKAARNYQQAAAVQGAKDLQPLRETISALEDLLGDYPYMIRMFDRLAKECGGRKEDWIAEAEQDDWARRTNKTRGITPVMDLQRQTEDLLGAMRSAVTRAFANEILPPPEEYGFEKFPDANVGMWSRKDVTPSSSHKPRKLIFEVTKNITDSETYEIIYDHDEGPEGLSILSTGLYVSNLQGDIRLGQMTRVAEDIHDGFTGDQDKDNIYLLHLKDYDNRLRYFVVAEVYAGQPAENRGVVWLRKKKT